MKHTRIAALIALLAVPVLNAQDAPKDQKDKVSYGIGLSIGTKMKRDAVDLNPEMIAKGLNDGLSGAKPLMTEDEVQKTMQAFQTEMQSKMAQKQKTASDKNKSEGEAFLAANKAKEGVKTLPSGLQYKIITEGKGDKPKSTDTVTVNYRGTLIDGTEFDSSYKRNEPVSFPLDKVIPGWTEGLQLLPVGTKAQLVIPAALAYGENAPPSIGPNATLIFDVELLEIKKPEAAAKTPVTVTTEPVSAPTATPAAKKKKQ
jgi:FKBP-type peptidyl-prolyl cis-trans isomerase